MNITISPRAYRSPRLIRTHRECLRALRWNGIQQAIAAVLMIVFLAVAMPGPQASWQHGLIRVILCSVCALVCMSLLIKRSKEWEDLNVEAWHIDPVLDSLELVAVKLMHRKEGKRLARSCASPSDVLEFVQRETATLLPVYEQDHVAHLISETLGAYT